MRNLSSCPAYLQSLFVDKQDDWSYIEGMSKREAKKEQILNAGLDVMRRQGYNGTGVKDIVEAAGVPKGSFYNYFDSKEAFAVEALAQAATEVADFMRSGLGKNGQPVLERLLDFFAVQALAAETGENRTGCFVGTLCQEMAGSCETIRLTSKSMFASFSEVVADLVEEGKADGSIGCDMPSEQLADLIINAWQGTLLRMKAVRSRKPMDDFCTMLPHLLAA